MKKITVLLSILATLTLLILSSCSEPDIGQSVALSLKVSKTADITFGDKINVDYAITSTLEQPLTKEDYTLQISQARIGETSRTIITDVSKTIPVKGDNTGTFVWNIDGIPGNGGEFNLYLTFYKKLGDGAVVVKETSQKIIFIEPKVTK